MRSSKAITAVLILSLFAGVTIWYVVRQNKTRVEVAMAETKLKAARLALSNYLLDDGSSANVPQRHVTLDEGRRLSWRYMVRKYMEHGPNVLLDDIHPGFSDSTGRTSVLALDYSTSPWRGTSIDFDERDRLLMIYVPLKERKWAEPGDVVVGVELAYEKDVTLDSLGEIGKEYSVVNTNGVVERLTAKQIAERCGVVQTGASTVSDSRR